jgi:hypothetical protein
MLLLLLLLVTWSRHSGGDSGSRGTSQCYCNPENTRWPRQPRAQAHVQSRARGGGGCGSESSVGDAVPVRRDEHESTGTGTGADVSTGATHTGEGAVCGRRCREDAGRRGGPGG